MIAQVSQQMARFGILVGVLLCAITALGLFTSMDKSTFQFFPMMLGIPILFCGVVGLNPHRRRAAVATAAAVSLVGLVIGCGVLVRYAIQLDENGPQSRHALKVIGTMWGLCLVYFVILGRWILARQSRNQAYRENGTPAVQESPE